MQNLEQLQAKLRPKIVNKEAEVWKEKWVKEFTDHETLRRQYAVAQDIIHRYQHTYSKLCYRCKAKDKISKIELT